MISAFGVEDGVSKGVVGRLQFARAAKTINRLTPPDYMRRSELSHLSRRDTRKVASAAQVHHRFEERSLARAENAVKHAKGNRLQRAYGKKRAADFEWHHERHEKHYAPGLDMAMGTSRGTNGARELLERGSDDRHARNLRHVQQAVAGRRGGRTLYRGMEGVHLKPGDVHDAGHGASWTTARPRAEHFARGGGSMQGNAKHTGDSTPVMLKLKRSSRRAVPIADRGHPEHFLGGQYKVTRTRQRGDVTVHTVKSVKKKPALGAGQ